MGKVVAPLVRDQPEWRGASGSLHEEIAVVMSVAERPRFKLGGLKAHLPRQVRREYAAQGVAGVPSIPRPGFVRRVPVRDDNDVAHIVRPSVVQRRHGFVKLGQVVRMGAVVRDDVPAIADLVIVVHPETGGHFPLGRNK